MPLVTEIIRSGEPLIGWDGFMLNCMYTAALRESCPDTEVGKDGETLSTMPQDIPLDFFWRNPVYCLHVPECPLVARGEQTLLQHHEFDRGDGSTFELFPGDRVRAWRE